jgi:hypothetical protein
MVRSGLKALKKQMMDGFLSACEETSPRDLSDPLDLHEPRALVIMGQQGSGRFKAAAMLQREYFVGEGGWERPAVVLEENFRYLHDDVGKLLIGNSNDKNMTAATKSAHKLEYVCIKALAAARRNILLFARSNYPNAMQETLKVIKTAGYRIEVVALAAPGMISASRMLFEYEWLRQKTGMAFTPILPSHTGALHKLAPLISAIETHKLASRIRVLDVSGTELYAASIPLRNKKVSSSEAILREQTRTLSAEEYRHCLELLSAVASGMDDRNVYMYERRMVSDFINRQFADRPEALDISNTRIAKISQDAQNAQNATNNQPQAIDKKPEKETDGKTRWHVSRYLHAFTKREPGDPQALVVIGPPGSGTFKAAARLQRGARGLESPAVVCFEEFRYQHRLAKRLLAKHLDIQTQSVSKEARRLERGCLKAIVEAGRNIVWLTRGEFQETILNSLEMMQSGGYKIEAAFLAVPGKISAARAIFEYEWLKGKTGMAFMPLSGCHNNSLRFLSGICRGVAQKRLANRVRVLNGEGGDLRVSGIPLIWYEEKPYDVIRREQSREISTDERRRCLEMLTAVADGMDRRAAPFDERYMAAAFIRSQFRDDPEVLYIVNIRIAKDQFKNRAKGNVPPQEEVVEC